MEARIYPNRVDYLYPYKLSATLNLYLFVLLLTIILLIVIINKYFVGTKWFNFAKKYLIGSIVFEALNLQLVLMVAASSVLYFKAGVHDKLLTFTTRFSPQTTRLFNINFIENDKILLETIIIFILLFTILHFVLKAINNFLYHSNLSKLSLKSKIIVRSLILVVVIGISIGAFVDYKYKSFDSYKSICARFYQK
jgi:hypothetical protein